ncbi:MAG: crotonase/enoyl-CoA hydratase family protein [Pseudomonadota bacterium]
MSFETLDLETDARGVCTVTLNRPQMHNALSAESIEDLASATQQIAADKDIRVVVLSGAGPSFCAGADLGWMRDQIEADRVTRMSEARKLAHMLRDLNVLPKPLIGRVNGTAMGGGLGLMAVCDIAIVADNGRFGFTETRLGLIPATIAPYVVARMGEGRTRRVFMNSKLLRAADLVELDLAARVVAAEDLDSAIESEVTTYLRCAPIAVARSKALARRLGLRIDVEVIEGSINDLADTWEGPEARVGIRAFFDKTRAPWG